MMINFFANIIAIAITVPLLISYVTYIVAKRIYKNSWRALHLTVNWTTILYIFSVGTLVYILFNKAYFGMIFIMLLIFLLTSIVIQWKLKGEIFFGYAWKGFWRFSFLLFGCCYIGLTLIGLVIQLL